MTRPAAPDADLATAGRPGTARASIAAARTVVVKVGSSSLTSAAGGLDPDRLDALVDALAARSAAGSAVVLVSSGAIAAGLAPLHLTRRPRDLATQQAAASVGQQLLAQRYAGSFARHRLQVGQVLLTSDDVVRRSHYRNAQRTFAKLLSFGVVPVVNENDTVATAEIRFGDNDRLAALVAHLVGADALVLLSDVDSLYTGDPRLPGSRRIPEVRGAEDLLDVSLSSSLSDVGTGGMASKLSAAAMATGAGIPVLLANAAQAGLALAGGPSAATALDGSIGTAFAPAPRRTGARLFWLRHAATSAGSLTLDGGAVAAVVQRRKSLLPAGILAAAGDFESGDVVDLLGPDGIAVARGFVAHDAAALPGIIGKSLSQLPPDLRHEVVHADDLIAFSTAAGGFQMTVLDAPPTAVPADGSATAAQVLDAARRSKAAAAVLAQAPTTVKNAVLQAMAATLRERSADILSANDDDVAAAEQAGTPASLVDRLLLSPARIESMAGGLEALVALPDPIGTVVRGGVLANGLTLSQVRVPLGVVAIIYEARPNVTVDAAGIALKSGNAALLRGSASAHRSNAVLVAVLQEVLAGHQLPPDAVQLVPGTDRASVTHLMTARGLVDVIIPRGGAGLIKAVVDGSTVPVLETGVGNCHVYVDASADRAMALDILINSKVRRPSVCNAAETLLVHSDIAASFVPMALQVLADNGVTVHGDEAILEMAAGATHVVPAVDADFDTEYLSLDIAAAVVPTIDVAIGHINAHGTGHTEAIVTSDLARAHRFAAEVDAAAVMVNASTAFTDGAEFGLGAEIGISTQKLHARGPMGLAELTSTKYIVTGSGQTRASA